jgi:hypothetical protein
MITRKLFKDMTPNWTLPVELEVIEPIGSLNQRRTLTDGRISNTNAVSGFAKMNFLLHACHQQWSEAR